MGGYKLPHRRSIGIMRLPRWGRGYLVLPLPIEFFVLVCQYPCHQSRGQHPLSYFLYPWPEILLVSFFPNHVDLPPALVFVYSGSLANLEGSCLLSPSSHLKLLESDSFPFLLPSSLTPLPPLSHLNHLYILWQTF